MLKVESLFAGYDSSSVLFGMTFGAEAGQAISLIGRNGMGKTTTVRSLMGWLPMRGGEATLAGIRLNGLKPHAVALAGMGLVPEGRRIFGSLTVHENLVATARINLTGDGMGWSLERVFALFPRLNERRRQSARTLSGGEQQMLAVGRALMTNPRMLVLDEATEGLAPLIRREIWDCLRTLKSQGMTILVIDKNIGEMGSLIDRHHIVEKGRVVWSGTPAELGARPELAQRFLGI